MPTYSAYIMGETGHIKQRLDLVCEDDEDAKQFVKQLVDGHAIELWQRARRIDRFEPE